MSEKGSIYVHLDWHIGHYVKILLDEVFGEANFQNEIIWHYESGGRAENFFSRKHDIIFVYSNNIESKTFSTDGIGIRRDTCEMCKQKLAKVNNMKKHVDQDGRTYRTIKSNGKIYQYYDDEIVPPADVWSDISHLQQKDPEREEYSTQKPEELLYRIIRSSSHEGMIIADFFSGSGTTAKVAHDLGRKFITCDIGVNAIQTTRKRLVKAGAEFDILKIKDGVRLFRNPAQTTAKIFSLIDGFKTRTELGLGEFWEGGIVDSTGKYVPVKFIQLHERLTKELLDVLLEKIYQLQDVTGAVSKVKVIYAHREPDITQQYVNKTIKDAGKTTVAVDLVGLDELLGEKADKLFMPDSAEVVVTESDSGCKVEIKRFFSPYLKTKLDEYNAQKAVPVQTSIEDESGEKAPKKKVTISDTGLELIEAVQFDTTLKNGVWKSNTELEDKAGIKEKIKGVYQVPVKRFKMKIRNIAGDEIILQSEALKAK